MKQRIELLRSYELPRTDIVSHPDSIAKLLKQISRLSCDAITYTSDASTHVYDAHVTSVYVLPSMFRRFVCTSGCTACCQKFTLDYTVSEFQQVQHKEGFVERWIEINGKRKIIYTNNQNDNPLCDFLRVEKPTGGLGCAQWPFSPLSCASAPQIQIKAPEEGVTVITKQRFDDHRSWTPVPQCQFEESDLEDCGLEADIALLDRFYEWSRYFGIVTCIPQIQRFLAQCLDTGLVPTRPYLVWGRS